MMTKLAAGAGKEEGTRERAVQIYIECLLSAAACSRAHFDEIACMSSLSELSQLWGCFCVLIGGACRGNAWSAVAVILFCFIHACTLITVGPNT